MVLRNILARNRLDRLVQIGIERLTLGLNRLHTQLRQRIVELTIDQVHAFAKLLAFRLGLQRTIQAIQDRQQSLDGVRKRVVAKILLLLGLSLAEVIELRLQTRQAIEQRIALRFQLL